MTAVGSDLILFGGKLHDDNQQFKDLYIFHTETLNWSHPETSGSHPLGKLKKQLN